MKFKIKTDSGEQIAEQFPSRTSALRSVFPDARVVGWTPGMDDTSYNMEGEDGTLFCVVVEDVFDGSERECSEAIGRDLSPDDWGKTATEIIQSEQHRRESRCD